MNKNFPSWRVNLFIAVLRDSPYGWFFCFPIKSSLWNLLSRSRIMNFFRIASPSVSAGFVLEATHASSRVHCPCQSPLRADHGAHINYKRVSILPSLAYFFEQYNKAKALLAFLPLLISYKPWLTWLLASFHLTSTF